MKRLSVCLITLAALLGVASAPLAAQKAQQSYPTPAPNTYVVKKGDSAWKISGDVFKDPLKWRVLLERNPILRQKGRVTYNRQKDWYYVMMHPGEKLFGLQELGILPEIVPVEDLPVEKTVVTNTVEVATVSNWTWWLVSLALLALAAMYAIYRMLTKDPVTAGPPIVPGGVTEENAGSHIQQMAARQLGARTGIIHPMQEFTIVEQVAGRIFGVMNVSYADGRSVPRQLHGEQAYRALVRFPDGKTETLYMLQGCGNDLKFGGISRYLPGPDFRFEADQPVVTADVQPEPETVQPEPEPTSAEVTANTEEVYTSRNGKAEPVAEPEPVSVSTEVAVPAQAVAVETVADGTIHFEFKRADEKNPNMVRLQGIETEDFQFTVTQSGTTLRYREVQKNKN